MRHLQFLEAQFRHNYSVSIHTKKLQRKIQKFKMASSRHHRNPKLWILFPIKKLKISKLVHKNRKYGNASFRESITIQRHSKSIVNSETFYSQIRLEPALLLDSGNIFRMHKKPNYTIVSGNMASHSDVSS